MGKIIALMNEKGGVGKSSLTYSCAWRLAEQKHRVLIIDMDGQMANITYISGVFVSDDAKTMNDVLMRNIDINNAILAINNSPNDNLFIVPATAVMADAMTAAKISKMKKSLKEIKDDFDYIFLDVNPSPDWKHALTLSVLDYVGIIMLPDVLSLEANMGIIESIEEVQGEVNPYLQVLGLILNQYDGRMNLSKAVKEKAGQMASYLNTKVFDTTIRKAVVMGESASDHKGITGYAPKSEIAGDIVALVNEMESEVQ